MEANFAVAYDGFVQKQSLCTFEQVKERWQRDRKNRFLYEYDCSVYELNADGSIKRRVDDKEMIG